VVDQRPWSSPLGPLFPLSGFRPRRVAAACLYSGQTSGPSDPIRAPQILIELQHSSGSDSSETHRRKQVTRSRALAVECAVPR
jgi:hypothetical protein